MMSAIKYMINAIILISYVKLYQSIYNSDYLINIATKSLESPFILIFQFPKSVKNSD